MIVLFKKGTGKAEKFNEFGFESLLTSGEWFLSKDDALAPKSEGDDFKREEEAGIWVREAAPVETETARSIDEINADPKGFGTLSKKELCKMAKNIGIKHYWTKSRDTLIEELNAQE